MKFLKNMLIYGKWRVRLMNITYKYGFYVDNRLIVMDVRINADFQYYKKLKSLLQLQRVKGQGFVRLGGSAADGHYVLLDSFKKDQIVYSFGINNDVSFDWAVADRGCQVFMYDHTINNLPRTRESFNFFKEGVAGEKSSSLPLDTLENYIKRNGHSSKSGMILKMDVEGAEWEALCATSSKVLKQFDQIVLEFHGLIKACNIYDIQKRFAIFEKLNKTHQLVHLHGNNTGHVVQLCGATFPDVIEVTYVNKARYKTFEDKNILLPTSLDLPNDKNRPDLVLGNWNAPLDENMLLV